MATWDFGGMTAGGGSFLAPGSYLVETLDEWSISKNQNGNTTIRVPFRVEAPDEFAGTTAAFYQTIVTTGDAKKQRGSQFYFYTMLVNLGITSDEDKKNGAHGCDPVVGKDENEYGAHPLLGFKVNGEDRSIGGKKAIAVVVADNNRSSGFNVLRLEKYVDGWTPPPINKEAVAQQAANLQVANRELSNQQAQQPAADGLPW